MISMHFLVLLFSTLAQATTSFQNMVVHESRATVPQGFVDSGLASPTASLRLRVGLVQNDMAGLEQELYAVSTPGNARYGQHLTPDEIGAFVTPPIQSTSLATQWLTNNNVSAASVSPFNDLFEFNIPVKQASNLFNADFHVYTHVSTGSQFIRTMEYSIPSVLVGHLDFVHPMISFANPQPTLPFVSTPAPNITFDESPGASGNGTAPAVCNEAVTPACLEALYGIPTTPATQSSNLLGVTAISTQFDVQNANDADLKAFLTLFRPDLSPSPTFTVQAFDGGVNSQNISEAGAEANLDIQYTVGIASDVPTVFLLVGDQKQEDTDDFFGFTDLVNTLIAEASPPSVVTTSIIWNENQFSQSVVINMCNLFMQLGARGVSVLFASGDFGTDPAPDGSQTFLPLFPSTCPFITSVGGTMNTTESAWSCSSGGFSDIFARPSYQDSAVSSYLSTIGDLNEGLFNSSGRAFPDISAQANNIIFVLGRFLRRGSGTSAASPIFASIIALLNDELVAAGKSPLGFLNPFVYSEAGQAALNDITTGSNAGCLAGGTAPGFPATVGWDAVTGMGTPNFAKLRAAVGL